MAPRVLLFFTHRLTSTPHFCSLWQRCLWQDKLNREMGSSGVDRYADMTWKQGLSGATVKRCQRTEIKYLIWRLESHFVSTVLWALWIIQDTRDIHYFQRPKHKKPNLNQLCLMRTEELMSLVNTSNLQQIKPNMSAWLDSTSGKWKMALQIIWVKWSFK